MRQAINSELPQVPARLVNPSLLCLNNPKQNSTVTDILLTAKSDDELIAASH